MQGSLGSDAASLNNVDIASGIFLDMSLNNLAASTILVHDNAELGNVSNLKGAVTLGLNSSISLNGTNPNTEFSGTIDGTSNSGIVFIEHEVTIKGSIGASNAMSRIDILSGGTMILNSDVAGSLNAAAINLFSGSKIYIGSGSITGDIVSSNREGDAYLTSNFTLNGDIGQEDVNSLSLIMLSPSVTINAGANQMDANSIILGANSIINSSGIIAGGIRLDSGAVINFNDGGSAGYDLTSGSINGEVSGNGTINTKSGSENIYINVGQSNNLAAFNVEAGSQAIIHKNIAAENITIAGEMNLANSSGNNLSGNVAGSGSGTLELNSYSHNIFGNLTLNSGDSLALDVLDSTNSGKITASNAAIINSQANLKLSLSGSTPALGSKYVIISASDGSQINAVNEANISLDNVATNRLDNRVFTTSVLGNSLVLNVDRYRLPELLNTKEQNLYNNLATRYDATGKLAELQDYLDSNSVSVSDKKAALNSADSQVDNSSNRVIFDNANKSIDLVSSRISQLSGYNTPIGLASGDAENTKAGWIEFLGSKIHQGNASGLDGYSANSQGTIIGFDKKLENDVIVGIAGLYSNSSIKSTSSLKRTDISSYQLNLYASSGYKNLFINAVVGAGLNRYSSHRHISGVSANAAAKYSGHNYVARFETGAHYKIKNDFILTPIVMLTAARNSINSFEESGADTLNLNVKNDVTNFLEGRVGLGLSKRYNLTSYNSLVPYLSLSYGYDFIGDRQKAVANFAGQSATFSSSAARIAQGSTKIGAGLKLYNTKDASLSVGYELDHRSKYHSHNGFLRLKYGF